MSKSKEDKIFLKIIDIVEPRPEGIRYKELWKELYKYFPERPVSSIQRAIGKRWERNRFSGLIYKPEIGLYRHIKYIDENVMNYDESDKKMNNIKGKMKKIKKFLRKKHKKPILI